MNLQLKSKLASAAARPFLAKGRASLAFTLIELLIVVVIIAVLATIGLPALRGFGSTNAIAAANRQILDDLAEARLRAINQRSTVYVVFIPPQIASYNWNALTIDERKQLTNLINGQFTSYNFFSRRSLGDQPGQDNPRYLSEWKHLPEGIFIATNKFVDNWDMTKWNVVNTNRAFAYTMIPFPTATNRPVLMPYVAFDYRGQLLSSSGDPFIPYRLDEEIIPLAQGSVIYPINPDGSYKLAAAEAIETPRNNSTNNRVHIDWLTGRARVVIPSLELPL